MSTPAAVRQYDTSPEQSNPPGAWPPHRYGVPIWARAVATTVDAAPGTPVDPPMGTRAPSTVPTWPALSGGRSDGPDGKGSALIIVRAISMTLTPFRPAKT